MFYIQGKVAKNEFNRKCQILRFGYLIIFLLDKKKVTIYGKTAGSLRRSRIY